jgi:hypothetical protein
MLALLAEVHVVCFNGSITGELEAKCDIDPGMQLHGDPLTF